MGALSFFGCFFAAYGPSITLFILYLGKDAQNVLVMMGSAFFYLLASLLSSLFWYFIPSIRSSSNIILSMGAIIQEIFRFLFFLLLERANTGLFKLTKKPISSTARIHQSFAAGYGFGVMSALIGYIAILPETLNPGMQTCASCPSTNIAFIAAIVNSLFTFLHIFWSILAFHGWTGRFKIVGFLQVFFHLGASLSTLLIGSSINMGCFYTILILLSMVLIQSLWVLFAIILKKEKNS